VLQLQELGFTNAWALLGGLNAWREAKLPTDPAP
jgi:rhodanese-related sulfurtransferase